MLKLWPAPASNDLVQVEQELSYLSLHWKLKGHGLGGNS